jgi:dienelactone hydrolase
MRSGPSSFPQGSRLILTRMSDPLRHYIGVRRTAAYYTLGGTGDVTSVWYVLHGYRQLAHRFIERFRDIATPPRLIVAPEALNRFYLDDGDGTKVHGPDSPVGATWMTRHDREAEIADYVAYLDTLDRSLELPQTTRRIVLGFSQGSQTAARWATMGRARVDRLVMWGGLMPRDLASDSPSRLGAIAPVFVTGEADHTLAMERVEAERARLAAAGVESGAVTHAGGHVVDADALRRVVEIVDPD